MDPSSRIAPNASMSHGSLGTTNSVATLLQHSCIHIYVTFGIVTLAAMSLEALRIFVITIIAACTVSVTRSKLIAANMLSTAILMLHVRL